MDNSLERLFKKFNEKRIDYCILRKYEFLPEKPKGDVDIFVQNRDLKKIVEIILEEGFFFYPHTEPHYFFFKHDFKQGLLNIDLTFGEMLPKEKFKDFFVPKNKKDIRLKKSLISKINTKIKRFFYYFGRGRLICIVGPDGSGKSTIAKKVYESLEEFPLKKELIYFGTKKKGRFVRSIDLLKKIIKVYLNKILGRITITDRYVYLTFRHSSFLNNFFLRLSPKPNKTYLMKVNERVIQKRKMELTINEIRELYSHYRKFEFIEELNNEGNFNENVSYIINEILSLTKKKIKTSFFD